MRVAILSHSSRGGGGLSVARNLIAAFGRVAPDIGYFLTVPPELESDDCWRAMRHLKLHVYCQKNKLSRWLWETSALPRLVQSFSPDVIFNMANRSMLRPCAPQATLVQDPHLFYPVSQYGRISLEERLTFWYHRRYFRRTVRRTQTFLCQTEVAGSRLKAAYGTKLNIMLCPNHVSTIVETAARRPARVPPPFETRLGMLKLCVITRYYAHKNLEVIPEAFLRYREALRDVLVILTVSRQEHRAAARLLDRLERLDLQDNIVSVGPLGQDELHDYYAHCDAVLLPTLLESSSGAYLEAQRYGLPVLTSDLDFARAACGDRAVYFDPLDPGSVARAIASMRVQSARLRETRGSSVETKRQSWDVTARSVLAEWQRLAVAGRDAGVAKSRLRGHS